MYVTVAPNAKDNPTAIMLAVAPKRLTNSDAATASAVESPDRRTANHG